MCAHQQQAARRRPMCEVRVREIEYVVHEHERVVALTRGDRKGSSIRRRAVLAHSIVERSTRYKSLCHLVRDAVFFFCTVPPMKCEVCRKRFVVAAAADLAVCVIKTPSQGSEPRCRRS